MNLGAFLRFQTGAPLWRYARFARSDGLAQGTTFISVSDRAGESNPNALGKRYDAVAILDLRAEKQFTLGRYGIARVYFDLFNVANANTVTSYVELSGSTYATPVRIVPPRVFRLGAAWDF